MKDQISVRAPPGAVAAYLTSHLFQGTAWLLARPRVLAQSRWNLSEVDDPQPGSSASQLGTPTICWMCTISNAFEDNGLISWKKENGSKITSGKLWHSTLKWSYTHVESLNSCMIILQNLPQEPTCHWIRPQIPAFLKQKEPWCGRSCNQPDGREVEIDKIGGTLCDILANPLHFVHGKIKKTKNWEPKKRREFPKITQWKSWNKRTGLSNSWTSRPRCLPTSGFHSSSWPHLLKNLWKWDSRPEGAVIQSL